MYINIKKNIIRILLILVLLFIVNTLFINFKSFAVSTKEITIKYLDEEGNTIKTEEKKQIEMGNENVTKYVSSYEEIPDGTDLFPDEISGYIIQSAKIKTYYNGEYRESGFPDEGTEHSLIDNDRVAIINPKSTDLYIVEFIYKKDSNTVASVQENIDSDKENSTQNEVSNNETSNLGTDGSLSKENNKNKDNNLVKNNSTTNSSLPKAGRKNRIAIFILLTIIVLVISIIKDNKYKYVK